MNNETILAKYCGAALYVLLLVSGAAAQEKPIILQLDVENVVNYVGDVTNPSMVARNAGPVTALTAAQLGNFFGSVLLSDVAAVNDKAAKGLCVDDNRALALSTAPTPGQAIADVTRSAFPQSVCEFVKQDGTSFGALYALGFFGGGTSAIVGGTGAFLGAKGDLTREGTPRRASQAEDPSMRRINGGGRGRALIRLFPMFRPEILVGATGPVVFHSDYSPVTAASPARAGETLIVYAKGLGPTSPSVNPGEPFPNEPLAIATSPVEVLVNGRSSPAINQIGVPGTTDTYRVDFRVPDETPPGPANVQISAAWVNGAPVQIPVW
jgi:hypothetical protein